MPSANPNISYTCESKSVRSLSRTRVHRKNDKILHWGQPLVVFIVICSIPNFVLTIRHSSILMIYSTVNSSICLLLAAIELSPSMSWNANSATSLYLNAFLILEQDGAMQIRSVFFVFVLHADL
jgi:cellobiose-specific phosphotransferase system component IIC